MSETSVPPVTAPPSSWLRRIVIGALLVFCVVLAAKGCRHTDTSNAAGDQDPVIVSQTPLPGSHALSQSEVSAVLLQGYDGRLTINGIAIPEGQMEGAVDPSSMSAADFRKYGLRPNNRNTVAFQPGPGKVLTSLPTGEVTVTVHYFRDRLNQQGGRTVSWSFTVD